MLVVLDVAIIVLQVKIINKIIKKEPHTLLCVGDYDGQCKTQLGPVFRRWT